MMCQYKASRAQLWVQVGFTFMGRTVFPDGQVYAGIQLKHHDFAVGGAPATVKVGFVVFAVKPQCSYFVLATGVLAHCI